MGGSGTTLATASVSFATGTWYTVSLQVSGASLRGTVGTTTLTATDSQFSTGQIGVATFNASADFDDVLVDSVTTPGSSGPGSPSASSPAPSSPAPSSPAPSSPTPSVSVPPVPGSGPIGFASLNALGQNGTTGGVGGATVTVTTTDALLTAIDTVGPLIIRVQGTINITSKQGVRPNKTIVGVGNNATINGGGFDFYKSYNVIVQNLTFADADDDSVNIGQNSHHIWIDHNTFLPAADGSVDIVRGADYVTVSWNHFNGTDKTMLISHSDSNAAEDTGHLKVTIHHNYFDGSTQRHPRVRFGEPVHVYNNYYRSVSLYAVASTMDAGVYVEANYFEQRPVPVLLSERLRRQRPRSAGLGEQRVRQLRYLRDQRHRGQPAHLLQLHRGHSGHPAEHRPGRCRRRPPGPVTADPARPWPRRCRSRGGTVTRAVRNLYRDHPRQSRRPDRPPRRPSRSATVPHGR